MEAALCLAGGLGQVQEGEQAGAEPGRCLCRAVRAGTPGTRYRRGGGSQEGSGRPGPPPRQGRGAGSEGGQGGGLLVRCSALRTVKSQKQ